jgi:hypothetical protein
MGTKTVIPPFESDYKEGSYDILDERGRCCGITEEKTISLHASDDADDRKEFLTNLGDTGSIFEVSGMDHLLATLDANVGECECISTLTTSSHGGWDGQGGFSLWQTPKTKTSKGKSPAPNPPNAYYDMVSGHNAAEFGTAIAGVMCEKCTINIMSCGSAEGNTICDIAKNTGCNVRGTIGDLTRHNDGSYDLTPSEDEKKKEPSLSPKKLATGGVPKPTPGGTPPQPPIGVYNCDPKGNRTLIHKGGDGMTGVW